MKTRIVHTKIWSDNYYVDLSPIEKFLFLYFLANENVNIIHCYECPDRKIVYDTGITKDQLEKAKQKFETSGKIYFNKGYVLLKNASKYEEYTGPLNEKAKDAAIKVLDRDILSWRERVLSNQNTPIYTPIDTGKDASPIGDINHKSEIINQKEEVVKGKHPSTDDLTEEVLQKISQDYKLPLAFVISKADDLKNWCAAKGKSFKNYPAALRNWVKRDAEKIVQSQRLPSKSFDATQGGAHEIAT